MSLAVVMQGITKRFGPLVANRSVELAVERGTVHAIVGENGAGKSTLMKILSGVLRPDEGTMEVHGEPYSPRDPAEASARGVGMVYQHFMLVEPFTVAENVVLGAEPSARGLLDVSRSEAEVRALADRYGLPIDPAARVRDLSVGERQRVEILKVLYRGADVLILDEPTAVLTPRETDGLFEMLREMAREGKTVLLITHKLDEVMAVSQEITVLRAGETVARVATRDTDPQRLAHLMVGREVSLPTVSDSRPRTQPPGPGLRLEGITLRAGGRLVLDHVDLQVYPGEILGLAGVQGNGQTELMEVVAGLTRQGSGRVVMGGKVLDGLTPRQRLAEGLAHIPEDRHRMGLVLGFTVEDNLILGRHRGFGTWLRLARGRIRAAALDAIRRFDIRPADPSAPTSTLSGGNQQKIVVARALASPPKVLLTGQPTRGVDIGAVADIHTRIIQARDRGAAVLLVSADLSEILALSDRVAVMYRGRVVATLSRREADRERLGELMMGIGGR